MKKFLSLLLALCLIVGMLPVVVLAEETTEKPAFTWYFTDMSGATSVTIHAGDATMYWATGKFNEAKPDTYYIKRSDKTNWNVKLEYPADGIPTLTMIDAEISTGNGMTFQGESGTFAGACKVVFQGTNKLFGTLTFHVADGATIAGPGKMTLKKIMYADSAMDALIKSTAGDLIFDHADVRIDIPWASSGAAVTAVSAAESDIIIKGGKVDIVGANPLDAYETPNDGNSTPWTDRRCILNAFRATADAEGNGGNLTIQDGANVRVVASPLNRYVNEAINLAGNLTIRNSDVEFATVKGTLLTLFSATPKVKDVIVEFDHGYEIYATSSKAGYSFATDKLTAPSVAAKTDVADVSFASINYLRVAHICRPGEPVLEKPANTCSTTQDQVTYCTVCNKDLVRTPIKVTAPEKVHTPGKKEELVSQRGTISITTSSSTTKTKADYVFQYTCSVCGETWTEKESFGAATFWYTTSAQEATSQKTNYNSENANNYSSSYLPRHTLTPGAAPLYFITTNNNSAFPDNYYVQPLTDQAQIEAGEWNIKLEYPLYGTPVLTLKKAKIVNCGGLWFGFAGYATTAPLKVVVQEDSSISGTLESTSGALNFRTTGDVTITGPGKLDIISNRYGASGAITCNGNLLLDNVNINITLSDIGSSCHGISVQNHDLTIRGGSLTINGWTSKKGYGALMAGLYVTKSSSTGLGGNLTIEEGANVLIFGDPSNSYKKTDGVTYYYSKGLIAADTKITIADSTVELAVTPYHGNQNAFSHCPVQTSANTYVIPEFEMAFTNGYNMVTSSTKGSYSTANGYAPPAASKLTTWTEFPTTASTIRSWKYFKVTPKTTYAEFDGTNIVLKDSLDMNFGIAKSKVDGAKTVVFTVNGASKEMAFNDVAKQYTDAYVITLPNVAAKELADPITVTVLDENGNALTAAKTDSAKDYAMRMIRAESVDGHNAEELAALKTLLVDTLIYASMAQVQFNHNTDNLATADLTPAEWALASGTVEYPEETAAVTDNIGYLGTSFILENNIRMAIAVSKSVVGEDVSATVTFTNNAGEEITNNLAIDEEYSGNKAYVFITNDLVAADGQCQVTFRVYKAGEDAPVITVTDSMLNYVGRMVEKYPYLEEMIKYCNSAKAYFDLKNAETTVE